MRLMASSSAYEESEAAAAWELLNVNQAAASPALCLEAASQVACQAVASPGGRQEGPQAPVAGARRASVVAVFHRALALVDEHQALVQVPVVEARHHRALVPVAVHRALALVDVRRVSVLAAELQALVQAPVVEARRHHHRRRESA